MTAMAIDALRNRLEAVVIGASAGGIDALLKLLPALPADAGVAVFVVLHLPRDRRSLLVEIFAPKCAVPVVEPADKEPVVPGTVYFAPPDYHLLIDSGPRIALSVDEPVNYSRPSIDVLFESAADVYQERLMGIVLTGGNHDGAAGLATVQLAGGVSVVQEPGSAHSAWMPTAALQRVDADFVLPLEGIAVLLRGLRGRG
ncbi:MAG: chemotaxis protein CheB [Rhizobiales bacterium]|nr:chemotaxis protein CheB [Rhizobacter sp.]